MFITNLGGGEPGVNLMGVIGTLANWPFLFAEFEEENPWESLAVSKGHRPEDSTLTMYMGGWSHAGNYGHERFGLAQVAEDLVEFENARGAVVIISPKRAEMLAAAGMGRKQVQEYLAKNAKGSLEVLRRSSYFDATSATRSAPGGKPVEIYTPDAIDLVVAGGDASPMMQAWHMGRPVTVSIDAWR